MKTELLWIGTLGLLLGTSSVSISQPSLPIQLSQRLQRRAVVQGWEISTTRLLIAGSNYQAPDQTYYASGNWIVVSVLVRKVQSNASSYDPFDLYSTRLTDTKGNTYSTSGVIDSELPSQSNLLFDVPSGTRAVKITVDAGETQIGLGL